MLVHGYEGYPKVKFLQEYKISWNLLVDVKLPEKFLGSQWRFNFLWTCGSSDTYVLAYLTTSIIIEIPGKYNKSHREQLQEGLNYSKQSMQKSWKDVEPLTEGCMFFTYLPLCLTMETCYRYARNRACKLWGGTWMQPSHALRVDHTVM